MSPATTRRSLGAAARLCVAGLLALAFAGWPGTALAQTYPALTQPVNDFAGVIKADAAARMDRQIRALQAKTGDAVVVATVRTIAPEGDIRAYAVKLFENGGRGIGEKGKENGLLVLLAVEERRVWVEVGYGLEEFVTDGYAGETSRQVMVPYFKQGDYGEGLAAGVEQFVGRIAEKRNVTLDGVPPPRRVASTPQLSVGTIVLLLFIFLIVVRAASAAARNDTRSGWGRRRTWSGWSSGVGPFGGGFGGFGGGRSGGGGGGASW